MSVSHIRVVLPFHLRTLAGSEGEVTVEIVGAVTQRSVLDALEDALPGLKGTIREHTTLKRRAFVRFFAAKQDLSHAPPDEALPESVANGEEPFRIVGAMAGG